MNAGKFWKRFLFRGSHRSARVGCLCHVRTLERKVCVSGWSSAEPPTLQTGSAHRSSDRNADSRGTLGGRRGEAAIRKQVCGACASPTAARAPMGPGPRRHRVAIVGRTRRCDNACGPAAVCAEKSIKPTLSAKYNFQSRGPKILTL